jgi:Domain of unknown function (DUF4114)
MKTRIEQQRAGPGIGAVLFVALSLMANFAAVPPDAGATLNMMGGQLYYTGGDVTVDVIHRDSAYRDVLQLQAGLAMLDIVNGQKVGTRITLTEAQLSSWGISVGDELKFGIRVLETNQAFVLGPGSRNADGLEHAYLSDHGRNNYYVGLEDLYGGGDRDYNDTVLRFSGGVTGNAGGPTARLSTKAGTVAEPASILLVLTGIGLLTWMSRRNAT